MQLKGGELGSKGNGGVEIPGAVGIPGIIPGTTGGRMTAGGLPPIDGGLPPMIGGVPPT